MKNEFTVRKNTSVQESFCDANPAFNFFLVNFHGNYLSINAKTKDGKEKWTGKLYLDGKSIYDIEYNMENDRAIKSFSCRIRKASLTKEDVNGKLSLCL